MKKIFYILVSAIVALGAVACENEGLENINPNVGNGEGLSFVATIDAESRVALDGTVNSWELEDKVVINGYTFTCTDAKKGIFFCEKDNVRKDLIGKGTFTATYSNNGDGKVDSSAGAKGAVLTATGSFTETAGVVTATGFNFTLTSALLKFTTTEKVTISAESGLFGTGTELTFEAGNHLVAVNANAADAKTPKKYTLSYRIGDVARDKAEFTPVIGKIYNLGSLKQPTFTTKKVSLFPNSNWKLNGAWFVAYFFNETNTPVWVKMTNKNGKYECSIPEGFEGKNMILVRMDGSKTALNWNSKWNQTNNLTVPTTVYTTYYFENDGWDKGEIQARWCQMLYLQPSNNWKESNARFAAYFCNGLKTTAHWWSMTVATTGIYQVPRFEGDDSKNIIFCRMNPGNATNNWDNKWNQTGDLTFPEDNKVLFVPTAGWWNDMGDSCWTTLQ